jgi:hypothetical protein
VKVPAGARSGAAAAGSRSRGAAVGASRPHTAAATVVASATARPSAI